MIPELPEHWKKLAAAPPTLRKPHEAITHTQGSGQSPKPKRTDRSSELALDRTAKEGGPARLHVRFTSIRKRLCDPDNLVVKWLLDSLRYCGAIPGDEPDKITLEVQQRKVRKGEGEFTMIEIYQEDTASAIEAVRRSLL